MIIPAIFPFTAYAAPVAGSVHDFSSTQAFLDSGVPGVCAECHTAHGAFELGIWVRDIVPDAVTAGDLCLDCHDGTAPTWASPAPPDQSDLKNSLHDFTGDPVTSRGSCFACHDLHTSSANTESFIGTYITKSFLWGRDLTEEFNGTNEFYQKRDLGTFSGGVGGYPNYLIGATVMCFDCHSGDAANNGPDDFDFSGNPPQDIAFGGDRGTQGGTLGYYELPDGREPDSNTTSTTDVAPTLSEVQSGTSLPGGHFVKTPMQGNTQETDNYEVRTPDNILLYKISIGDKLPCEVCHDPHLGESASVDQAFFRRDIYAGEGQLVTRGESEFNSKLLASGNTRNGTGNGRLMCIYCHGTSDWDGSSNPINGIAPLMTDSGATILTLYGIRARPPSSPPPGASTAFPPPATINEHSSSDTTTECTSCHNHNNINAACGGCHEFPPTSGAHLVHSSTADGKPEFNCETCHGPSPGSAAWHNESSSASYDSNNPTHYNNITLINELTVLQRGTEQAYYDSTWNRSGQPAPTVTKAAGWAFTCTNVQCHGMDPVIWTWQTTDTWNPSPPGGYKLCGGCHGATTDIDGDGNLDPDNDGNGTVDVSSFWSRAGTYYEATSTAANYEVPLSGFSRGGHGDTAINNPSWFTDTAPGESVPVACNRCHDTAAAHFNLNPDNPYRIQSFAADANTSALTKLCLTCHPSDSANFAFYAPPKHSNDHYLNRSGGPFQQPVLVTDTLAPVNLESASSTSTPAYDPVGTTQSSTRAVGVHIDRYVDHWEWWGTPATGDSADRVPFLPLGDSLEKNLTTNSTYNNDTNVVVTCITCHNPHGSDLFVFGETPGSGVNLIGIPANKMLRLRDQDDELCDACH